jgi:lysophospholipase
MQANASGRLMDTVLFDTPENPHPDLDGTRHVSGHFSTRDGRRLRYAIFKSAHLRASHAPRGTIVLLHGRNEYIEKYFETIADLTAMGFWVATFDWRGQGASERLMKKRQRGFVRRFTDYEIWRTFWRRSSSRIHACPSTFLPIPPARSWLWQPRRAWPIASTA